MADLAVANTEEKFQQKLKELLDKAHLENSNDEVTLESTPLNEDDCYDVDLNN